MSVLYLFTFMYRTCPEFGHISFNGLHFCLLHCRWSLKTSELWNNTYGMMWYTKNLFYISDSFAFTALHILSHSWGRHLEWFFHCCGTIFVFHFFFSPLFLTWPVEWFVMSWTTGRRKKQPVGAHIYDSRQRSHEACYITPCVTS